MDIIFVLIGLSVPILFMFKEEWLYNKKILSTIFLLSMFLFIAVMFYEDKNIVKYKTFAALKMPLLSTIIFFCLHQFYVKKYKRNPENTFWSFSKKSIEDILFTILFWIFGIGLPALLFL
jgi:hypothetical protein